METTSGQRMILEKLFPGREYEILCASENGHDENGTYRGKWLVKVDEVVYIMKDDAILETIKHFSK